MLRLILFTLAALSLVATAGIARADVTIYVEDFENEQGGSGLDPLFDHEFSADPDITPYWRLGKGVEEYYLYLGNGTTDTITFNLPSSAIVTYGSVVLHEGLNDLVTSIRFIGSEGSWQSGADNNDQRVFEITSDQIGVIEQIELYSKQGIFNSVTITVVPEASSAMLILSLVFTALFQLTLLRRKRL